MKVSYEEGLANYFGLQRRGDCGNNVVLSVRVEGNAGQPLSSEIIISVCRSCPVREKATSSLPPWQGIDGHGGVVEPVHAWTFQAREREALGPSTIRRRLSALSSLFVDLVSHGVVNINPVREVKRPELDRTEGQTPAFSQQEARKVHDAPDGLKLQGLRDRAILACGFQVGLRRMEIAGLLTDALHRNMGLDCLWVKRKRKRNRVSVTIHPQTAQRIRDYLQAAAHGKDHHGPLFRPVANNQKAVESRRHLTPDAINRIVKRYARLALGDARAYSAHSMRATFATVAK